MKKRLLSLALAAIMATGASAQENKVKMSVNAGPQWNSSTGILAGADVFIPFGNSRWGFEPGLYWSFRNVTSDHSDNSVKEEYNDKLHYVSVPLRLTVRMAGREDAPFKMSFFFGPYLAYGIGGTSHCAITRDGQTTKSEAGAFCGEGRLNSRFDYGLDYGLNAVIKQHIKVGAFIEVGLKDIYRQNHFVEELIGDIFGVTKINIGGGLTLGYQF